MFEKVVIKSRDFTWYDPKCIFLSRQQSEDLAKTNYDFETVHCIDPYKSDFVPTMREAMKHWNITIQYWLASYVYKPFPYKKYRTNVTMLVSAVWHGVYAGYYFCIATVPFALLYEDVWVKLLLGKHQEKVRRMFVPLS